MSINKAYNEIIKGKKGETVIVAVIDSGTDVDHEDLQGSIWTNKNEIPDNNKDDDGNGYIDDVNGWNFLGNGYNEQFEHVCILVSGNTNDSKFTEAQNEFNREYRKNALYKNCYEDIIEKINISDKIIAGYLKNVNYTKEDLAKIDSDDEYLLQHVSMVGLYLGIELNTVGELKEIELYT